MTSSIAELVKEKIVAEIKPTPILVNVVDNSDGLCEGGAKLEVTVVSDAFDKMPLLKRHRLVHQCLNKNDGLMDQKIHALSLQTWTVAQYESKK